jgi:hypothetical protein
MQRVKAIPHWAGWAAAFVIFLASWETRTAPAQILALESAGPLTGGQAFGGNLGMDFVVHLPIEVTALGVFDSEQNGIAATTTLEVAIWERDDNGTPEVFGDDTGGAILVSDVFFEGLDDTLDGVYRLRDLTTPITLQPGAYTLNAFGYGTDEPLYNNGGNPNNRAPTVNESNGAIRFVGVSRFGTQGPGTFPETPDGGPPARYFAGTFVYTPPDVDAFLRIDVDRESGEIALHNDTSAPVTLLGYSIQSGSGALDPAEWTSIADNYDADGDMSVDPDDTWVNLTNAASRGDLSEFELDLDGGNGATLAVGQSVNLGSGPWIRHPSEDLQFRYIIPDGTRIDGIVNFIEGTGEAYPVGDLNFDGAAYTLDDFLDVMLPHLVSDQSALSVAEAYHRGDLDGDLDVDLQDFRTFKQNFVAAGGSAAALAAAAAGVPEPAACVIVAALCAACAPRFLRRVRVHRALPVAFLAAMLPLAGGMRLDAHIIALDNPPVAGVQNFSGDLGMDFVVNEFPIEVTTLGAFDSNQDGWFSEITVELWSRNDAGTPGAFGDDTGIDILATEVFNSQSEGSLIGGSRFHDLASSVTLDPGSYTIVARGYGPDELLANAGQGSPVSTINDSGGILQFVGGSRFGTNNTFPDVVDGGPSNRYLAGTFVYDIDIDPLVLEVSLANGDAVLLNEGATNFEIDTYEIRSPSGSLNVAGWNSLADQNVEGWQEGGASNDMSLVEVNLTSSTLFGPGASRPLGRPYNTSINGRDLIFEYTTISGLTLEGGVRFEMGGPVLLGDYNANGQVEQADLDLVLLNWGQPGVPNGWTNDLPTGNVDQEELDGVLLNWGNMAAAGLATSAVPEPATSAIAVLAMMAAALCAQRRRRRPIRLALMLSLGIVPSIPCSNAFAERTNDRTYRFGDENLEDAAAGLVVGRGPTNPTFGGTLDSAGPTGAFVDLLESGGPTYVDVGDRPGASSGALGIEFDGADDYLFGPRLGLPSSSISAEPQGPLDYSGISNRGFQLWVRPDLAGSGSTQNVVLDTNQHGLVISDDNRWTLRYNGVDVESEAAVAFDQWSHVMVVRPSGAAGGARLYVNGVAVAARTGGFDGNDNTSLVVGSNTGDDVDVLVGTEDFYQGILDDLELFVLGTSTSTATPYGTFNPLTDNQFIASELTGIAGDVNQDGALNQTDVDAFVAGWLSENRVGGLVVGDLNSYRAGDLNATGVTDLDDAFLLHSALVSAGQAGINFGALNGGVPEPRSLALVACGLASLAIIRMSTRRKELA